MRRLGSCFVLAALLFIGAQTSAFAEHKLEPGDVLEFSVVSLPNLRQRATIDQEGVISFPFMNGLHTEGFTISQLRAKVQALTSAKPFRQRGADGKETLIMIDADEISLDVIGYRPIYVNGDVAHPSEQQYRPGLTVRQAIVLSGGVDELRGAGEALALEVPGLKSEVSLLKLELTKQLVIAQRARAALNDKSVLPSIRDPDVSSLQVAQNFIGLEAQRLALSNEAFRKEQVFLQSGVKQASDYLSVLTDQLKNEREGADLDAADFKRVSELFKTGAVAITRVMDARRAMLLSSTRLLQTGAQRAQSEIRRDDVTRQLDKLSELRRTDLLKESQDAELNVENSRLRLKAVEERLSRLVRRGTTNVYGVEPDIAIFRRQDGKTISVSANMDSDVLPGDVIEIRSRAKVEEPVIN